MSSDDVGTAQRPGAATSGTLSSLNELLELQEVDLELDRLVHRRAHLPERAELSRLREAVQRVDGERARIDSRRSGPARRQAELEKGIDDATARIKAIEQRLYHGEGYAFRDQQAMLDEVNALGKRRTELEDEELEIMEVLEPLDAEMATADGERAQLVERGAGELARLEAAEREVDAEVAKVQARRAPLVAEIAEPLALEYERLRGKLGGVGVARLVKGSCTGCHLVLPATELDRIRHLPAGTLVHCDQCGRLLVS